MFWVFNPVSEKVKTQEKPEEKHALHKNKCNLIDQGKKV